jgi:hypothetical protein
LRGEPQILSAPVRHQNFRRKFCEKLSKILTVDR